MELTVKLREFEFRARVLHELEPESAHRSVFGLEWLDNLGEVPREGEHMRVAVGIELHINTQSAVTSVLRLHLLIAVVLGDCDIGKATK